MNFLGQAANITTEFREKELNDPINYKVNIRSMNENEEVHDRYKNKPRQIKEKDSINSFRINSSNLKKHINPSDLYEEELRKQNKNKINLYEFSSNYLNNEQSNLENINSIIQSMPPDQGISSQLIHVIDHHLNNLQEETKLKYEQNNKPYSPLNYYKNENLKEKNVQTQFIKAENGVYQVLKHVQTQNKVEYMNLEDIQKEREENGKRLIELEERYKDAKNKELLKEIEEKEKMNKKFNYNPEILEELKNILEKENELFNFNKKKNKYKKPLKKSNIENEKVKNPINKNEEEFVKEYAKYVVKKRIGEAEKEELNMQNKEWNQTRILSKNINGIVERNDDLPGYMGKDDYQMYYYNIKDERKEDLGKFKAPHWGVKYKKNKSDNSPNKINYNIIENNNKDNEMNNLNNLNKSNGENNVVEKNDSLEIKDIDKLPKFKQKEILEEKQNDFVNNAFETLDTKKIGLVTKSQLVTELKLDYDTIGIFGFNTKQDFIDKLDLFQTRLYNHLNPEELKNFIVENTKNKNKKINKNLEKNNKEEKDEKVKNINLNESNEIENEEEEDDDYLPVYGVKNDSFDLDEEDEKKLKPLTSKNLKEEKLSFPKLSNTNKIYSNNKNDIKPKSSNIKDVTYEDYKKEVNKYKSKDNINFTIPQPFSFDKNKRKSEMKSKEKIKELKDEREKLENDLLNKGFKANKLKNEIFIGNISNFIEGEKKERQRRVEKRMEKIEKEMKPFSFVIKDEEKQKEKMEFLKKREKSKEKFPQFKANNIKYTTRVNMNVENWEEKEKKKRNERIKKKSKELLLKSKLPPRLEQHKKEKEEKQLKEEKIKKQKLKEEKSEIVNKKNNKLPNY